MIYKAIVSAIIISVTVLFIADLLRQADPCHPTNTRARVEMIIAHELCIVEESCAYDARDIVMYHERLKAQEFCGDNTQ